MEENDRMGKNKDLFRKIRDTKGIFHAKMGSIKDRNGMDLTEAEGIKKWWEYTEELYRKDLHDPDNHDDMITHLEPDILECEVKWALGSIILNKASGGDGVPVELFQILKDDAVKVLQSICQQIWKTHQCPQNRKRSVLIPVPKKGNAKECSKLKLLSYVQLFKTSWTVAYQASLSMGFSRQEYQSGLPFPSPEDLPDPGIEPRSPTLQADSLPSEPPGKPKNVQTIMQLHSSHMLAH